MDTKKIKILGIISNVFFNFGIDFTCFLSVHGLRSFAFNFVRFESRVIQYAFSR